VISEQNDVYHTLPIIFPTFAVSPLSVVVTGLSKNEHEINAREYNYIIKQDEIVDSKSSDDDVSHSELLIFWTLSIVRYSRN
jgi:hypothetical protein